MEHAKEMAHLTVYLQVRYLPLALSQRTTIGGTQGNTGTEFKGRTEGSSKL